MAAVFIKKLTRDAADFVTDFMIFAGVEGRRTKGKLVNRFERPGSKMNHDHENPS
jgi:hypothetical protein